MMSLPVEPSALSQVTAANSELLAIAKQTLELSKSIGEPELQAEFRRVLARLIATKPQISDLIRAFVRQRACWSAGPGPRSGR